MDGGFKFERVQLLRFVAAAAVVVSHAEAVATRQLLGQVDTQTLMLRNGAFGVDLFFVISGFIIRYRMATGSQDWRAFALRRIERIVPFYWFALLADFAFAVVGASADHRPFGDLVSLLLRSMAFVAWSGDGGWPLLSVGWTLEYEMFFYAMAAACLALTRWPAAALLGSLGLLVALGNLAGGGKSAAILEFATHPMLVEFMLGIFVANVMLGDRPWLSAMLIVAVLAFVPLGGVGLRVWMAGLASTLMVGAAVWLDMRRPTGKWLQPLVRLGDASYAIYLSHMFAMMVCLRLVARQMPTMPPICAALLAAVIAIAAGYAVHVLVERPMLRWIRSRCRNCLSELVVAAQQAAAHDAKRRAD